MTTNNESANRRKKYLINPKFQLSFVFMCLLPATVTIVTFFSFIQYYFFKLFMEGKELGLPLDHPYFMLLSDQRILLAKIFVFFMILVTILYLVWGIWISHKIAGPIYRLEKYLKSLTDIPESDLKFREGDYFLEIPESFNEWLRKIRKGKN